MKDIKASVVLNIEMNESEFLSKLNTLSIELSIEIEQLIILALKKLIYDIEFVREIRVLNKNNISP